MPDGGLSSNQSFWIELFGSAGIAGFIGKFWDHLTGAKSRRDAAKKDLQQVMNESFDSLVRADAVRMSQMQRALETLTLRSDAQTAEIAMLRDTVHALIDHIHSLENILRDQGLEFPPHPSLKMQDTERVSHG